MKGGTDGFLEGFGFFPSSHRPFRRQGNDNQGFGVIRAFFMMGIFGEGDAGMSRTNDPRFQDFNSPFNFRFPAWSHANISAFNFNIQRLSIHNNSFRH